jgi:hypothetical protein
MRRSSQGDGIQRAELGHCAWSIETVVEEWACPVYISCAPVATGSVPVPGEHEWKLGRCLVRK